MNDDDFADLVESIQQARQIERGELEPGRRFEFGPPDIKAMQTDLPPRRCALCDSLASDSLAWRCACGGAYEYDWSPRFDPAQIVQGEWSQWRYRSMLLPPGVPTESPVTLGEGMTPLVSLDFEGAPLTFKLEFLMPTGSYKDRGSSTLLTVLRAEGHSRLVEDSSGNAGASIAASLEKGLPWSLSVAA